MLPASLKYILCFLRKGPGILGLALPLHSFLLPKAQWITANAFREENQVTACSHLLFTWEDGWTWFYAGLRLGSREFWSIHRVCRLPRVNDRFPWYSEILILQRGRPAHLVKMILEGSDHSCCGDNVRWIHCQWPSLSLFRDIPQVLCWLQSSETAIVKAEF